MKESILDLSRMVEEMAKKAEINSQKEREELSRNAFLTSNYFSGKAEVYHEVVNQLRSWLLHATPFSA